MKKIKWCVIGAGGIAERRAIPALLSDPVNELVAVMDKNCDVAKAVAKKHNVPSWFSDEEQMLKSVECDAVYIGTPVFCHYSQAMLALKYGINVFMEKPISMTFAEGKKVVDAFKAQNKQITIGYMMGYHNLHTKARKIIEDGGLGKVTLVRMQFSCWYPDIKGAWRQNRSLSGGGCIMDLAVHCMELFSSVTGDEIEEIKSFYLSDTFEYEVEDSAVIAFRSKGGILGHIDVNFNIPDNAAVSRLEIYGTAGSILAEGTLGQEERGKLRYIYSPQGEYEAAQKRTVSKPVTYYGKGSNIYTKQFSAFNKILKSGKPDYTNADKAVRIQAYCDSIYNS